MALLELEGVVSGYGDYVRAEGDIGSEGLPDEVSGREEVQGAFLGM